MLPDTITTPAAVRTSSSASPFEPIVALPTFTPSMKNSTASPTGRCSTSSSSSRLVLLFRVSQEALPLALGYAPPAGALSAAKTRMRVAINEGGGGDQSQVHESGGWGVEDDRCHARPRTNLQSNSGTIPTVKPKPFTDKVLTHD